MSLRWLFFAGRRRVVHTFGFCTTVAVATFGFLPLRSASHVHQVGFFVALRSASQSYRRHFGSVRRRRRSVSTLASLSSSSTASLVQLASLLRAPYGRRPHVVRNEEIVHR
ncbi:hypothetical protein AVEN_272839-1 [Araneus ventricosus]|uniref:Uncharacterized protein n=1 Tax=Araneus ventricosus TaxID=182803 RepID=A0A4Y2JRF8_ARAVE|nr:hypothetical protein AVEN_272839-1 [Araneus ventricosus]